MRIIRAGEHIQHIPGYGISVREGGVAVAAANWWEVPGKTCVAAYQPKGAASYAASKVNLANPGTYDAAEGVAPTWAAATGWTFDGTTTYLVTGVIPAWGWTVVGQVAAGAHSWIAGEFGAIGLRPSPVGNRYYYGAYSTGTAGRNSGNLAVVPGQGYWNGAPDGGGVAWSNHIFSEFSIGAVFFAGDPTQFLTGTIIALAFYSQTLSADEIAILSTAMNAL